MAKHSAHGTTWNKQRQRILERDNWTCIYCTKPDLHGPDATVDHLTPISLDPTKTYRDDELATACRSCNSRKQDNTGTRIGYHNPRWH